MVANPVFFDESDWVEQPADWSTNTVAGKKYDLAVGEGLRVFETCLARVSQTTAFSVATEEQTRYGAPQLVRPRLGQGTFRVAVTNAYGGACAVSREHSLPVLEAAHIRPFSVDGPHDVTNGLLLRADIHRLFDTGYVTVTPEHRFVVSQRLAGEWKNGKVYYALHGRPIALPARAEDHPDPELLRWHNEHVFESAAA